MQTDKKFTPVTNSELAEMQEGIADAITLLPTPIEFPCVVKGRKLTARIIHSEDTMITLAYHIAFSDGYEADFHSIDSIEDETRFFEYENPNSEYAKAVNNDLISIRGFRADRGIYCLPMQQTGEGVNAWILQDSENDTTYRVFTSVYRFTLKRAGNVWHTAQALPINALSEADTFLASKVCEFLDKRR